MDHYKSFLRSKSNIFIIFLLYLIENKYNFLNKITFLAMLFLNLFINFQYSMLSELNYSIFEYTP